VTTTARKTDERGIREVRAGVWEVRLHVGRDPVTGKLVQVHRTVRAERPRSGRVPRPVIAVRDELHGQLPGLRAELLARASATEEEVPQTLGELLDEWLEHGQAVGRSPSTVAGYRRKIEYAIRPALGQHRLADLGARDLDRWYAALRRDGTSPATIMHYHRIVSAALHQGVKWGLIAVSPAATASPPRVPRVELNVPPPERVRALIDLAATSRNPEMAAIITTAAMTGLRRGELCGLRWGDVDWQASTLVVERAIWQENSAWGTKPPKTHQVRRLILGPEMLGVLRGRWQRVTEAATHCEVEIAPTAYIFSPAVDGSTPLMPDTVTQAFARLCRRMEERALASLRVGKSGATRQDLARSDQWRYRLHDLRHYTATELFRAGVNPRTVADRLGHADPSITLRVYVSNTDDQARAAAATLETGLRG
jgi:integrase